MVERRAGAFRRVMVTLAWLMAIAGVLLVALGAVPSLQLLSRPTAMAAAFAPYGVLLWVFVSVVVLTSHRGTIRVLGLLAVGLLVIQVLWTRPYWPRTSPGFTNGSERLTVMTLNTYYGWADASQLMAEAERTRPDVVVLSEITTRSLGDLDTVGWTARCSRIMPVNPEAPGKATD